MIQLPFPANGLIHSTVDLRKYSTPSRHSRCLRVSLMVSVLLFIASPGQGFAADIAAGQKAASQCNVCHGKNGLATNPEAPNLAGESAIYIEKQLVAFKSGERQHRQMSLVAQGLELETIRNLAAWYQAMKVTVELPSLP